MKKYVALARVSSREQEREGLSLDVQEEALRKYAERQGGEILKLYRIAETASRKEERLTFKEALAYTRENAERVTGLLFYKVDRAARNLFDYMELEHLQEEHGVSVIYVAQPMENTPTGRMQSRMLANFAAFTTEQQSLDVREGMERRVKSGFFVGRAPYGYRNIRIDGRGVIELHPENAEKVRRIFELYGHRSYTLDSLRRALLAQEIHYLPSVKAFGRSKLHSILRDRAYIGEVSYKGDWFPGMHEPLIDTTLFNRVQALLGNRVYHSNEHTYAASLISCAHCGRAITGETKRKPTKGGEREYVYYRCSGYTAPGHPRDRVNESALDGQVLLLFDRIRIQDDKLREWFRSVLKERIKKASETAKRDVIESKKALTRIETKMKRLLELRIDEEISGDQFREQNDKLKVERERLNLQVEATDRQKQEEQEFALEVFELSQALKDKWLTADSATKRDILRYVCLNFSLDGATLSATMRKPFDVLAKGPEMKDGRGERI